MAYRTGKACFMEGVTYAQGLRGRLLLSLAFVDYSWGFGLEQVTKRQGLYW